MKKVLSLVLFSVILITLYALSSSSVSASDYSSAYGFTYDTDAYENVEWETHRRFYANYEHGTIGVATLNVGLFKLDDTLEEVPDTNLYMVMYRVTMTPYKSDEYTCNLFFTCVQYGYSNKVTVSSEIDKYASGYDNELVYYDPTTKASSTTYTVGLGLNVSAADGLSGGISASKTFTVNDINLTNLSQSPSKFYGTVFDYNMRSFVIKNEFYEETYQYGMYIIENPTDNSYTFFSNYMDIKAEFGLSEGWGRYDIFYSGTKATATGGLYFNHTRPNT